MISKVAKVVVPVDDQEEAKKYWTELMGFEASRDETFGDERWIEVSPPSGSPVLVLSKRTPSDTRPPVPDLLPHSPVLFTCDDINQTFEELTARGVVFSAPPAEMHFGWWAMFEDPEGTRFALGQWP